MKLGLTWKFSAGMFMAFALGVLATYLVAVRPTARWSEEQPLYFLAEQTMVLKSLRNGKEPQVRQLAEQAAWENIRLLASRASEGILPPESLKPDIEYHCGLQRTGQITTNLESSKLRVGWCQSLSS